MEDFDNGSTHKCIGVDMGIPSWVSDGDYILQWSYIGGYNSKAVATKQLPIYHTCANIRISGGVTLTNKPDDWIAPFYGGDKIEIDNKSSGPDQCAYKNFAAEPSDPSVVDVNDVSSDNIRFGGPDGWAGANNKKRLTNADVPLSPPQSPALRLILYTFFLCSILQYSPGPVAVV